MNDRWRGNRRKPEGWIPRVHRTRDPGWITYARVSSRGQEDGTSIDVQHDACRAWALTRDEPVVRSLSDTASGTLSGLSDRTAWAEAIRSLRDCEATGIVLVRLDRLARDVILQETMLREVEMAGGELAIVNDAENALISDPDGSEIEDASRRMIRQILGAVNDYERAAIRARCIAGATRARNAGIQPGPPPFGFRRGDDRRFHPQEPEYSTMREAMQLRLLGLSWADIATFLNERGCRPYTGDGVWVATAASLMVNRALKRHQAGEHGAVEPMPLDRLSTTARLFAGLPEVAS